MLYDSNRPAVPAGGVPAPAKKWRTMQLMINGLRQEARYSESTITGLFRPFLQRLSERQRRTGGRFIVFLAAPPAVGKSTLALFLEKLSLATPGLMPVQALGLDGFHYHSDYLNNHDLIRDGEPIPLYQIKGAPETFDVAHFLRKLQELRAERELRWPIYDRTQHDVVEDVQRVYRPIVLIEGNWLLLRDEAWEPARAYADYTVFVKAHPNDLKTRLINRKMQGGRSYAEAEAFYERTDSPNVLRVLRASVPANETWIMGHDGDFHTEADLQRRNDVNLDFDFPTATILQNFSDNAENGHPVVWQEGFKAGMDAARKSTLRQLFHNGSISSKELCNAFNLSKEDLQEILHPPTADEK